MTLVPKSPPCHCNWECRPGLKTTCVGGDVFGCTQDCTMPPGYDHTMIKLYPPTSLCGCNWVGRNPTQTRAGMACNAQACNWVSGTIDPAPDATFNGFRRGLPMTCAVPPGGSQSYCQSLNHGGQFYAFMDDDEGDGKILSFSSGSPGSENIFLYRFLFLQCRDRRLLDPRLFCFRCLDDRDRDFFFGHKVARFFEERGPLGHHIFPSCLGILVRNKPLGILVF